MLFVIFPLLLLNFPLLSSIFVCLVTVCLGVFFLGFILPGSLLLGLGLFVSFSMFGKFSAIISSNIFLGPFSLSSPSETPVIQMLVRLMLSQRSLRLSSFLFILFSIFCSVAVISTILSSRSFICSSASVILLLIPSGVLFISVCSLVLLDLW